MAAIKDRAKVLVIREVVAACSAEALQELVLEDSNYSLLLSMEEDNLWEVTRATIIRSNKMRLTFNTLFKIASPI